VPDSPAASTLQVGDELVAVSGRAVDSPVAVAEALTATKPGQSVTITYKREGQQRDAQVVLGSSPDRPQGLLGVRPGVEPRAGDIKISLGDIGGPSAGLMFALAVVDKLTPGELTGGRFVAGTGTITQDGGVGPIGGIPFKMRAARDAGATAFLVPADNCAEAKANAPDGLQLLRVGDLDDAVAGLDALRTDRPAAAC
jgi:PDZ domain-containing protein